MRTLFLSSAAVLFLATGAAHAEDYAKEYRIACENEYSDHTKSKAEAAQMRAEIERCVKRAKDKISRQ
jgi:hypothetical protein